MKKLIAFGFLFLFCSLFALADEGWLGQIKERIQSYWNNYSPNRIYLQTDRDIYVTPDTVWVKAYIVAEGNTALSKSQGALHIDLTSEKNAVVLSQRLNVRQGVAIGAIALPDSLKSGQYLLQGYGEDNYGSDVKNFVRRIIFINTQPEKAKTVSETNKKTVSSVRFFPEGQSFAFGLESKIAFKAVAPNGAPVFTAGTIVDENNKVITRFQSDPYGIGSFFLRPLPGKTYTAQIKTSVGIQTFSLPTPVQGIALNVDRVADTILVTVAATGNNLNQSLGLIIRNHGEVLVSDSVLVNKNGLRKFKYLAASWPAGLLQANLFTSEQKVIGERLFFKPFASSASIQLTSLKTIYGRREPVKINLQVRDAMGNPLEGSFTAMVVNNAKKLAPALTASEVFSTQLAESVIDPDYYLMNDEALDALLLTQKLRQSSWEEILSQQPLKSSVQSEGKLQVEVTSDSVKLANAVIYLMDIRNGNTKAVSTDAEGKSYLPAENTTRYFYQVWQQGKFKKDAQLKVLRSSAILPENGWQLVYNPDSLANRKIEIQQKVNLFYNPKTIIATGAKRRAEDWPKYPADRYYPLEEYNEMHTMEEIFREMIPSVRVIKRKGQTFANMYNVERRDFYPHTPLYIIDGKPTWNSDLFLRLDGSQIRQVNIYYSSKNLQPFGFMGNQGVIAVFTKNGNYQNPDLSTEFILNVPEQNVPLNFTPKPFPSDRPDFRSTLYWDPALLLNHNSEASFQFLTPDEVGELLVEVSGVTKNGQAISQRLKLSVNAVK